MSRSVVVFIVIGLVLACFGRALAQGGGYPGRTAVATNVGCRLFANLSEVLRDPGKTAVATNVGVYGADRDIPRPAFAIHLLTDQTLNARDALKLNIAELHLQKRPLFTIDDFESYQWDKHILRLKPNALERVPTKPPIFGLPFVVTVSGKRIYVGGFWTLISSYMPSAPIIFVDHPLRSKNTLAIGLGFKDKGDPRSDPAIRDVFEKAGKLVTPLRSWRQGSKKGEVCVNPKDGAEMVWIPAGEFLMGSKDADIAALLKDDPKLNAARLDNERPQRTVYLDGYWIYKYEVTVAQYRKFCSETGRAMPTPPEWGWIDNHPMVKVTCQAAADYAKWAEASLPTEAQWEKAARGTDGRAYPWGSQWDASKCNEYPREPKGTQPVGSYPAGASPYGCMDMAGNAWELCADWYSAEYYKDAPSRNPAGPTSEPPKPYSGYRVLRGGCEFGGFRSGYFSRCAFRKGYYYLVPGGFTDYIGFRLSRCHLPHS